MQRELVPGFRFSNGRLMIFGEDQVKVVSTWPDLEAVRKSSKVTNVSYIRHPSHRGSIEFCSGLSRLL